MVYGLFNPLIMRRTSGVVTLLRSKIGSRINQRVGKASPSVSLGEYTLVKDITPVYSTVSARVGIYADAQGNKFVIKRCQYKVEDLNLMYLRNEAYMLKTLAMAGKAAGILPTFVKIIEEKNEFILITGFADGDRLDLIEKHKRVEVILQAYAKLRTLSDALKSSDFADIPTRNPGYYLVSFMINMAKVIFKDRGNTGFYLRTLVLFYTRYLAGCLAGVEMGLVHRDLYADNILYDQSKQSVTVLDWESAIISDSLYDLAQIAMIYTKELGTDKIIDVVKQYTNNNGERRRFSGLAIFNSIQILAQNNPSSDVFKDTTEFLRILREIIIPALMYKKSPFERINTLTLDAIAGFYKLTGLRMHDPKKKIILCYHSVGHDGWRFSTRIHTFENHLKMLSQSYTLCSLPELLRDEEGGVHISFDDGYENVLLNAQPVLEKYRAVATMFALGNPSHANRKELDNSIHIMNDEQLLSLRDKGWEIGYHTYTHANLGTLNDAELEKELVEGKKLAEKRLGITFRYMAYPKGIYTPKVLEYVKAAGFEYAFTVDGKDMSLNDQDRLLLDRVPIEGELTAEQLGALISPLGLLTSKIFMRVLVLKERYITSRLRRA